VDDHAAAVIGVGWGVLLVVRLLARPADDSQASVDAGADAAGGASLGIPRTLGNSDAAARMRQGCI